MSILRLINKIISTLTKRGRPAQSKPSPLLHTQSSRKDRINHVEKIFSSITFRLLIAISLFCCGCQKKSVGPDSLTFQLDPAAVASLRISLIFPVHNQHQYLVTDQQQIKSLLAVFNGMEVYFTMTESEYYNQYIKNIEGSSSPPLIF